VAFKDCVLVHMISDTSSLLFWGLDAYYLRQERLFRCLYDKVCLAPDGVRIPTFSMDTAICEKEVGS